MSLKTKLYGAIGAVIIASFICLGYGIYGARVILNASEDAHEEAFPILIVANEFNQIIQHTNASFLVAMDGYEDFEDDVHLEVQKFDKIVNGILEVSELDPELHQIQMDFEVYVKKGLEFGRSFIQKKPLPFETELLTKLKNELTKKIEDYRQSKQTLFETSLLQIKGKSKSFMLMFLSSGAIMAALLLSMIVVIEIMIRAIKKLEQNSKALSEGDLKTVVKKDRSDELGTLQMSFETMRVNLADHIQNLDSKVEERTLALKQSQKEMEDILHNIDQGIVTFSKNLELNDQHSQKAEDFFEEDRFQGKSIVELLQLNGEDIVKFKDWMALFSSPSKLKRWKRYLNFNPKLELQRRIDGEERVLSLDYQPIIENDDIKNVMLLAKDVTDVKKAERRAEESQEQQAFQSQVISALVTYDKKEIRNCLEGLQGIVSEHKVHVAHREEQEPEGLRAEMFRSIHTLKGWCGTYDIKKIETCLDDMEGVLSEVKGFYEALIDETYLARLDVFEAQVNAFEEAYQLLYHNMEGKLLIEEIEFKQLLLQLQDGALRQQFHALMDIEFQVMARKYVNIVEREGNRGGKITEPLIIVGGEQKIPREMVGPLDEILIHLIRNAIDHGIEDRDTREAEGKGAAQIELKVSCTSDTLNIALRDNGRGVDPEVIHEAALRKGLSCPPLEKWSMEQAIACLFEPEFSTASKNQRLSGRGVGMDVIRTVVQSLGGELHMESETKVYTLVEIRNLPLLQR